MVNVFSILTIEDVDSSSLEDLCFDGQIAIRVIDSVMHVRQISSTRIDMFLGFFGTLKACFIKNISFETNPCLFFDVRGLFDLNVNTVDFDTQMSHCRCQK